MFVPSFCSKTFLIPIYMELMNHDSKLCLNDTVSHQDNDRDCDPTQLIWIDFSTLLVMHKYINLSQNLFSKVVSKGFLKLLPQMV